MSSMSMCAERLGAVPAPHPRYDRPTWPATGEVHVWEANLAAGDWDGRDAVLDRDERARASDFRFERDARRFVRSRVFRRSVLSAYLRIVPEAVDYREDGFGRPTIAPHLVHERFLDFSASKSGDRALLALGTSPGIGVDVEERRPFPDTDRIAGDFFNAAEARAIARVKETDAKHDAFFRCWTRKEALVKALGVGLHAPLDQMVVGTTPKEQAFRPAFMPEWRGSVDWWMVDLSQRSAFAALATSTPLPSLSLRRWTA
jgi:4'-phosphopantetheinyl transferase